VANFLKVGPLVQNLNGGVHIYRQHKGTFLLFLRKESRLKETIVAIVPQTKLSSIAKHCAFHIVLSRYGRKEKSKQSL
jgi:hypothetical protein